MESPKVVLKFEVDESQQVAVNRLVQIFDQSSKQTSFIGDLWQDALFKPFVLTLFDVYKTWGTSLLLQDTSRPF